MSTSRATSTSSALPVLRSWSVRGPVGTWILIASDAEFPTVVAASLASAGDVTARLTAEELQRFQGTSRGSNAAVTAVRAYFDGDVRALNAIAVEQPGSQFRQQVWRHMRRIGPGIVRTYGELASRAGSPNAMRAAGSACARNRIPLIVPCHRVVRADRTLGNYYYGVDIKRRLLLHEGLELNN